MKLTRNAIILMSELNELGVNVIAVDFGDNDWSFFSYSSITYPNPSNHIHLLKLEGAVNLNQQFVEYVDNPFKAASVVVKLTTMKRNSFTFHPKIPFLTAT